MVEPLTLTTLLGDYPGTQALKSGAVPTAGLDLSYLDGRPVTHFKRLVSALDIDIAEVPIMTFLMGMERGLPLVLLPAVVLGGYQHEFLFREASRTDVGPEALVGKRIGIRSYSVTTVTWLRDILERDYGVDRASVTWVAFEDPHFPDFQSPATVERAPKGVSAEAMLESGEIEAAVLRAVLDNGRFSWVIDDPQSAGAQWGRVHGGTQINHMVAAHADVASKHPEAVGEFLAALSDSFVLGTGGSDVATPIGRDRVLASLELAIECALRQGIISKALDAKQLLSQDFAP